MLALVAARLLTPTDHLFDAQEDDRIALAAARIIDRTGVDEPVAVGWLDPIEATFADGRPGAVPPAVSNTLRTLRALYVYVDRGVRDPETGATRPVPHGIALTARIGEVLRPVTPLAV